MKKITYKLLEGRKKTDKIVASIANTSHRLPCWQEVENLKENTDGSKIEWYIVSEYICGELYLKGEITLKWADSCFWGKTNNYVKMERDDVISEICEEMEILEGQEYEGAIKT